MKPVVYIWDTRLKGACDRIPHLSSRAELVHDLIQSSNLTSMMEVRESRPGTEEDLLSFHSTDYVQYLKEGSLSSDDEEPPQSRQETQEFGFGYDCPLFPDVFQFACTIVGGTLTAVDALCEGAPVAINWTGGWHHSQRDEASGFCYVNDIVIGIQRLLKRFKTVFYIDLDSHHGDGVENAFSHTHRVLTLSLHHYESGYFPGSGTLDDVGFGRGKYFSLNVPLKAGISDASYCAIFDMTLGCALEGFQPEAIVVQAGADCLVGDPLGAFNLTLQALVHCVSNILKIAKAKSIPVLFLGGGGYNLTNAARAWTCITAAILETPIPLDIPEESEHFQKYGPDFSFRISPGLRKDENSSDDVAKLLEGVKENCLKMKAKVSS